MRKRGLLTGLVLGAALLVPSASALAAPTEMTFTSEPVKVGGYSVERNSSYGPPLKVDRPVGDGFITAMW